MKISVWTYKKDDRVFHNDEVCDCSMCKIYFSSIDTSRLILLDRIAKSTEQRPILDENRYINVDCGEESESEEDLEWYDIWY